VLLYTPCHLYICLLSRDKLPHMYFVFTHFDDYEENAVHEFDKAEEIRNSGILLKNSERAVLREREDEFSLLTSTVHCCTTPDTISAPQSRALRFISTHSECTSTTATTAGMDWFRNLAGRDDSIAVADSDTTGQTDVAVYGAEDGVLEDKGDENCDTTSSQSNIDETKSTVNHSLLFEGCNDVNRSELASARIALQSSDEATSGADDDAESWTSDDEEPELRDLLIDSRTEMIDSKISDDYEKEVLKDETYNCDHEVEETQERNDLVVNENGTFEEVCLSSSTYYFACSGQDDGKGSAFVFVLSSSLTVNRCCYCCYCY